GGRSDTSPAERFKEEDRRLTARRNIGPGDLTVWGGGRNILYDDVADVQAGCSGSCYRLEIRPNRPSIRIARCGCNKICQQSPGSAFISGRIKPDICVLITNAADSDISIKLEPQGRVDRKSTRNSTQYGSYRRNPLYPIKITIALVVFYTYSVAGCRLEYDAGNRAIAPSLLGQVELDFKRRSLYTGR